MLKILMALVKFYSLSIRRPFENFVRFIPECRMSTRVAQDRRNQTAKKVQSTKNTHTRNHAFQVSNLITTCLEGGTLCPYHYVATRPNR